MLIWLRKMREERKAVDREAATLVARLGATEAFWHARSRRRDRSLPAEEPRRLDAVMHRIYATADIYCPADAPQRYADPSKRR